MPSNDKFIERFEFACQLAKEAGELAARHFKKYPSLELKQKNTQDFVSNADGEVEDFIKQKLLEQFPTDHFFGEESGGDVNDNDLWVVDPIDGTSNFVRGIPFFCISIAFYSEKTIQLGVIFDPINRELFSALKGSGAKCNNNPMTVCDTAELSQAMVCIGLSFATSDQPFHKLQKYLIEKKCDVRKLGSGSLGLAYVAAGRAAAYFEEHLNAWDTMAGLILVLEAGGKVIDPIIDKNSLQGGRCVAYAPKIANEFLAGLDS